MEDRASPRAKRATKAARPSTRRLLVVDGSAVVRKSLARLLESLHFETVMCRDCREAADFFTAAKKRGNPFSGVIVDLTLCEEDSLNRFRADGSRIPVAVSSYDLSHPAFCDPAAHGFAGALAKPFGPGDVRRLTEEVF